MVYTSKAALINQLKKNLETHAEVRAKAVIRIYQNQTADEKKTNSTNVNNGIGFTGADASILSSFAKQLAYKKCLSVKQDAILVKRITKYARQLIDGSIAEGKIRVENGKYYTN